MELLAEVAASDDGAHRRLTKRPAVLMIVGVNGTGKTTTIGKLAWHLQQELGLSVIVAAADTYRAAAIEQLETWAERAGAGDRPRRRRAGTPERWFSTRSRRPSRVAPTWSSPTRPGGSTRTTNLMEELAKVRRVAEKRLDGAPHESLIVIDATTGQNGLRQAQAFAQAVDLTGRRPHEARRDREGRDRARDRRRSSTCPVKLIGVGEGLEDLRPFDPREFACRAPGGLARARSAGT